MALVPWNSPANVGFLPRSKFDPGYTAAAFGAGDERARAPFVHFDMGNKVGKVEDAGLWGSSFPASQQVLHILPCRSSRKAKEPPECCEHILTLIGRANNYSYKVLYT